MSFFGISRVRELKSIYDKKKIGLLINQASFIQPEFVFTYDLLNELGFKVVKIFSPQHGLFSTEQANMIPSQSYYDDIFKVNVCSLYEGNYLIDKAKLSDVDVVFVDIQDIGVRYYTYVWTVKLICDIGIDVVIFNRPNPLGNKVEGIKLNKEYFSFVGMMEVFNRHGLTIGDFFREYPNVKVVDSTFDRSKDWEELGLIWIPTSPNIPTLRTIYFYIGFALFEATNISEGRGTTYPFEVFGAPFINEEKLKKRIEYYKKKFYVNGVEFIYHRFKPTFDKYKDQVCQGLKMIITNKKKFHSIKTFLIVLKSIVDLYSKEFRFLDPPYEYEYHKMPIDILWGNSSLRENIYNDSGFEKLIQEIL